MFFGLPLRRFLFPKFIGDLAVQFVLVRQIEAMAHYCQSLLRSILLLPPIRFLATFIVEQGLFELAEDRRDTCPYQFRIC